MIHRYNAKTQQRWNRGELQVQLNTPGSTRPMGYCDGTDEDDNGFEGAWGPYPYLPSGTIAVSSFNEGLFLLTPRLP